MKLTRRRFIAISAVAAASGPVQAAPGLRQWHGTALGARTTLTLAHPDGAAIARRAFAEIDRLEDIFSLYRPGSALSRLNTDGTLAAPPFELLECLSTCAAVHAATDGRFDPTIQPLWALHAASHAAGAPPSEDAIAEALQKAGWQQVSFDPLRIGFDRPGMALTLNGVAQGYIADRIANQLRREGLSGIMIDTGELSALGARPDGTDWPVTLDAGGVTAGTVGLRDQALASSAPLGTTFDAAGQAGHILDPVTGQSGDPYWRLVSVSAPRAALADALSTAACLMNRAAIDTALAAFPDARLVAAVAA